ncbi:MAG: TCR/Tet family MFS transporter [Pseudomonadales bacterium]|nr:TCR/Tet family MFS transporter [Pseudomonadales bacterium]MCP5183845.1 TCR/Tet family MFS transporter [Pseudomonadales bacterium]
MSPASRRHALIFVTITILLDVIGFGIIMPVMPALLREITGGTLAEASAWGGYLVFSYALLQFVCAPLLGALSDSHGRRPVLLLSLGMYAVNYLLMGFATSLLVLFIGRILTGMSSATYATANALIADVTAPEERAQSFGLVGMAFGVGFIIGPALGGFLGEWDLRLPFFVAAGFALANTLYGLVVLKETLPADKRRPFDWRRANIVGAFAQLRRYPLLVGLIGAIFLYNVGHHVYPANWSFYTMAKFDWTPRDVGLSMGVVGILMAAVQGGLIRVVIPRLGAAQSALLGLTAAAAAYVGIAFAPNGTAVYLWSAVSALSGFIMPATQSMLSTHVGADAQGELQGMLASVGSVGAIVGPLLMTQTFTWYTSPANPVYFPGAAFLVAGGLTTLAIAVYLVNLRWIRREAASATGAGS